MHDPQADAQAVAARVGLAERLEHVFGVLQIQADAAVDDLHHRMAGTAPACPTSTWPRSVYLTALPTRLPIKVVSKVEWLRTRREVGTCRSDRHLSLAGWRHTPSTAWITSSSASGCRSGLADLLAAANAASSSRLRATVPIASRAVTRVGMVSTLACRRILSMA